MLNSEFVCTGYIQDCLFIARCHVQYMMALVVHRVVVIYI